MLHHFEKSPFVYDVMLNCSVTFTNTEWTLSFSADKAFYQIPAQSRLAELEAAAKQLSGRAITIKLAASGDASKTHLAKKTVSKTTEILDEEPLVQPQTLAPANSSAHAPEEVQQVLDIFSGGELIA